MPQARPDRTLPTKPSRTLRRAGVATAAGLVAVAGNITRCQSPLEGEAVNKYDAAIAVFPP